MRTTPPTADQRRTRPDRGARSTRPTPLTPSPATAHLRSRRGALRVALVDGNRLVADLFPQVLATADRPYEFVGSASRLMHLDALLAGRAADVAIVGNWLPDGRPREAVHRIRRAWPRTRILFLHPDPPVADALDEIVAAGADSLVSRQSDTRELLDAIDRTAAGRPVLPADVVGRLTRRLAERPAAPRLHGELTPRERAAVSALLVTGSTELAARRLGMSPTTCRSHLHRAMSKLGATSRFELIGKALRRKVIDPPRATRLATSHRSLTPRERAVLQALLDAGGHAAAAARLGLTESTVRSHLHGAMRKLDATTGLDALRMALSEGVIQAAS